MPFTYNETNEQLELSGELDINDAPDIRQWVSESIQSHLKIDLSAVDYMDSSILSVLLLARKVCSERGGELTLVSPSSIVMTLLEGSQMAKLFKIV